MHISSHTRSTKPDKLTNTFLWAGYEANEAVSKKWGPFDIQKETRHDELVARDYDLLLDPNGLGGMARTARESFLWRIAERTRGAYDFSRFERMMQVGAEKGIRQVWNINHFGYPLFYEPLGDDFIKAFAEYAWRAYRLIERYHRDAPWSGEPVYVTLINEISFWAHIGAEEGKWAPFLTKRGFQFKEQLVRASIAAARAIRQESAKARFFHTDPIMVRKARRGKDIEVGAAAFFNSIKYQSLDMVCGLMPGYDGSPDLVDVIGAHYYYACQEWMIKWKRRNSCFSWGMGWRSPHRISMALLLSELHRRYGKDIVISETGSHGSLRIPWWNRFFKELDQALDMGIPVRGVCGYPAIDYRDWYGLRGRKRRHLTNSGWWDFNDRDASCERIPNAGLLGLMRRKAARYE